MSAVWHDATQYSEGTLLVLLALADWANDEGWCWPSMAAIARKARLSERQVYRIVDELESDGVVQRKKGGGRGKTARFRIVVPRLNPDVMTGFPKTLMPAPQNPDTGAAKP